MNRGHTLIGRRAHGAAMVVRASLRLRHHGCITERLSGDTVLTQVSGERGSDVFVLQASDAAALERGLAIAESNGEKAEPLARTDQTLVFKGRNLPSGIVAAIRASPCWIVWPIVYRDGLEYYTLGAPSREPLRALIAELSRLADVRVERVVEETPEGFGDSIALGDILSDLTARQLAALRLASEHGYYKTPKQASSEELAQSFDVSPSTMREHLRKAEQNLIARIAALLEERPAAATRATKKAGRPRRPV